MTPFFYQKDQTQPDQLTPKSGAYTASSVIPFFLQLHNAVVCVWVIDMTVIYQK